jgi:hypothetical protein
MFDLIIKLMIKVTLINFSNSEIGSNDLNFLLKYGLYFNSYIC